jgi:hypothetical protein
MDVTEICPLTQDAVAKLLADRQAKVSDRNHNCRRRAARWTFPGTVELWVPDDTGAEQYSLATSINLSTQGIGIRADEPLKPGLEVGVAIHEPEVSFHGRAVVRHCTETPDETYIVGLQFRFEAA